MSTYSRQVIRTNAAPASPPAYSQAVKAAGLVFVSGTSPHDPVTGTIVAETIQEQTRQCLTNISAILEAAVIARRNHYHDAGLPGFLNRFAQRIERETLLRDSSEGKIDDPDVVGRLQRDGAVDGGNDIAVLPLAA